MKVTGMLISSEVYSEHSTLSDVQSAMGAAVIIHAMSWSSAESVEEGGKAGKSQFERLVRATKSKRSCWLKNYQITKKTGRS
ncbi:MAG: hypothetical protein CM15mP9_5510 [Methanobacteriota archaeon]|nr:MAG: hypothetical protein CM15mP9_5510 [Euryarchaeota archaeon]